MAQLLDRIDTDAALPDAVDVVVIGAGIIGISTALTLAERGVRVCVVEKGVVGGEQSSRNWGWCRTTGRDMAEVPLAMESVRLWDGMARRIGADVGFSRAGVAYVADDARELAGHAAWLERAREYQVPSRLLGPDETAALLPGAGRRFAGALVTASDGKAEPHVAVPAMAAACRRLGVVIVEGCAARGLDIQAGRVVGVVTERGTVRCDRAVLAGGAWSRLFCGSLGVEFPQLKVLGSVMRTASMAGPAMTVGGTDWAFRRRADGGYTVAQRGAMVTPIVPDSFRLLRQFGPSFVKNRRELSLRVDGRFAAEWRTPRRWALDAASPFEAVRVLDPVPSLRRLAAARRSLVRAFPGFAGMQVVGRWGGMIDVTPDGVPVIDRVAAVAGMFLASGFSGHGFGVGPGAGWLMADLVMGRAPVVEAGVFGLGRFG